MVDHLLVHLLVAPEKGLAVVVAVASAGRATVMECIYRGFCGVENVKVRNGKTLWGLLRKGIFEV